MKPLLLLAYLTACVVIGHRLAPSWQNDTALWGRTVEVAPHHARAMVNLSDALNHQGDRKSALFWAAMARQHANGDGLLPERERRTVLMAADSNMVSILLGWKTNAIYTAAWNDPPTPEQIPMVADFPPERVKLITELLEEIWQLQSAASAK